MAVGLEELTGDVGDNQAEERDGAHHGSGHRDAQGDAQQQAADAPVVVHAQVDGLGLAQGEYVQQGQILPQRENDGGQQHQAEHDDL